MSLLKTKSRYYPGERGHKKVIKFAICIRLFRFINVSASRGGGYEAFFKIVNMTNLLTINV